MALKGRDLKKAISAVGKSAETTRAPKNSRATSRSAAFQGAVNEIVAKTPSNWKQVVDEVK